MLFLNETERCPEELRITWGAFFGICVITHGFGYKTQSIGSIESELTCAGLWLKFKRQLKTQIIS